MASKMATMFGDRPPAAPSPIKYTSSCREDQRLSTEGKIISKYCNMSKTQGEFHHPTAFCSALDNYWILALYK